MKALGHDYQKAGTITISLVCTRCGATYGSGGSGGIGGGGVGPTITPTTRPGSMYDGDEGGNETLPPVVDEEVPDETIPPVEEPVPDEEPVPEESNEPVAQSGEKILESETTTAYSYIYASGKLLQEKVTTNGTTETHNFFYDNTGKPYAMQVNGTTYYYVTNLQGDVMGLVDTSGNSVASYTYDPYGKVLTATGALAEKNPLRYRGYYYDSESGLYYLQSRYYDPTTRRFINSDDTDYLGIGGTILSYNLFAYCNNNPIVGNDPAGSFDWGSLGKGGGWLSVGITALVVGVSVLTCGVATPLMVGVAAVTAGAGALTAINGVSEIGEAITGYNAVRDGVFGGNATAYNVYAYSTAAVAEVGTMICGGWKAKNAPRIEAYNNIQNYQYGDGAAKHLGERSYYESDLLQKQIIKYGDMVSEGNGVYTFRAAGSSFNAARQSFHSGTWELTVINSMKLIGHFLLEY